MSRRGTTWRDLLGWAAALPGTGTGVCYGTPAIYVRKRLLARLREDEETVAIKVDLADRDVLLEADPAAFYLTDHYRPWPLILMRLGKARPAVARRLLEEAWLRAAPKRLAASRAGSGTKRRAAASVERASGRSHSHPSGPTNVRRTTRARIGGAMTGTCQRVLAWITLGTLLLPGAAAPLEMVCIPNRNYEQLWRDHKYVMVGRVTDVTFGTAGERSEFTVSAIRVWRGKKKEIRLRNTGGLDGRELDVTRVYVVFANDDPQGMDSYCYPALGVWTKEGQNAVGRLDRLHDLPPLTLEKEDVQPRR